MATTGPDFPIELRGLDLERRDGAGSRSILRNLDFDLGPGLWLAVTGVNGSGKSSLLRYLASHDSPLKGAGALLTQDPEEQLCGGTVAQELALGRPGLDAGAWLEEFGLEGLADLDARLLAAGQKQRLALAVALAGDPCVLLCDEPTALQDERQAAWVLDRIDRWRRGAGRCLVTATCDRRELERADRVLVLDDGGIAQAGSPAEILPALRDAGVLVGEGLVPAPPRKAAAADAVLLELEGVGCRLRNAAGGFRGVDLRVGAGERLGLVGPNGCGKSTLLAACAGARRPDDGSVTVSGRRLYDGRREDLSHGAVLLAPQFPEYLFSRSTVADEMAVDPVLDRVGVRTLLERAGLPERIHAVNPHDLSGGQRRRLALIIVLAAGRPLVLLDEPTAGLDGLGRRLVLDLLSRLPAATALVVASHDIEFLAAAGCRRLALGARGLAPA